MHGTLLFTHLAWLAIGRVRAGAHRAVHDPRRLGGPTASGVHIVLQVSGTSTLEQAGLTFTLEPRSWALLAGDRSYAITNRAKAERLVMVTGRERLALDIPLQQLVGRAYTAASGAGRLLFSTALCLADELPYIPSGDAPTLAEQVTSLLHLALRRELLVGPLDHNEERRERVHRYISRHLRDPQLNVDRIAADLGWSRRTLARIFERREETLMENIYRERLESVRRDLLNPLLQDHTLANLARSWGFRNYTHFSARFHSHFGLSPTAVRARATAVQPEPATLPLHGDQKKN